MWAYAYRIAYNFGGVKLWRIDRFEVLVRENVGEFTTTYIINVVNLEFGWVKYWRMASHSPNLPKFSRAKIFSYTVSIRLKEELAWVIHR